MSIIKDNQRLDLVTITGPEHTLKLAMIRVIGEIRESYTKEQQQDWSEEDKLRAEGVRATCKTFEAVLDTCEGDEMIKRGSV